MGPVVYTWNPEGLGGKHTTSASLKSGEIIRPEIGRPRNERPKRDASYSKRVRKRVPRITQTKRKNTRVLKDTAGTEAMRQA